MLLFIAGSFLTSLISFSLIYSGVVERTVYVIGQNPASFSRSLGFSLFCALYLYLRNLTTTLCNVRKDYRCRITGTINVDRNNKCRKDSIIWASISAPLGIELFKVQ